jgi:hypothetical protein
MTCLARIFSLGIIVASLGCGKESLPQKPQLVVDRESLGFGQEFGSGVFIGTSKTDSIQISNGGLEDLKIESAAYTGDQAFVVEGPLKTTLKGKETTFIRVFFTPKAEMVYTGSILLVSNAETSATTKSSPMKTIGISGRGFKQVDGGP